MPDNMVNESLIHKRDSYNEGTAETDLVDLAVFCYLYYNYHKDET